ncbi:helix-turn-helix domain-containing protein [Paenibacillus lemnae]|uniref:Helix-turn-helix domain-containing protein n=1 Tax=Paenibacillus lemnae TaxID=1330551 RepID=A0A848M8C6_PAELE|nr:helix-turn-helix domain-containing protein [Paenibacillus lemnae]NMO96143.1 helix-turn-helix domain-containing protein [Paenibacillus lemnae]
MNWLKSFFSLHSLFYKMLIYFLIVITLLSSYNLWSMTYYSRNVNNEIVKYNLNLIGNTVDNFEKQYTTWKNLFLNLQHDEFVANISRQADGGGKRGIDYLQVDIVMDQIRTQVTQPYYHLNNVMVYYPKHSFLIERDGIVNDDRMFDHYYKSSSYPYEFWKSEDSSPGFMHFLPASSFSVSTQNNELQLLPILTNTQNSPWKIIAFVNLNSWYESYKGMAGSNFLLVNQEGTTLFQSAPDTEPHPLPEWDGKSEWMMENGTYYFFEKGAHSGLTYISVIPHNQLNQSISRMNWIAVVLFASTLFIGTLASWFFSRNINRPLRKMITGLGQEKMDLYQGTISEFTAISNHLHGLQHERNSIKEWMDNTKPLLTSYNYLAKFKNIEIDTDASKELWVGEGAFMVIVYQLRCRHLSSAPLHALMTKATGKIKDVITLQVNQAFPLSHTLQMEGSQIISIVYTQEKSKHLQECLHRLKTIFDHDHRTYLVNIGVSSVFQDTSEFDQAYAEAISLLRQAMPLEETQIIWEIEPQADITGFSPEQEHEFFVNVQAGNESSSQQLLERALARMHRQQATAEQLSHFAASVSGRMRKTLDLLKISDDVLPDYKEKLAYCVTPEQYREILLDEVAHATRAISLKREEHYDIIQYVIHYLESHYTEDISLEQLASKLNMSPTYLSGYIKEKTGSNFSDQLNGIRIAKAKELLKTTNMPIQEVGQHIAYRNVTSFIRMFKKITGQTPGDYRKTHWVR